MGVFAAERSESVKLVLTCWKSLCLPSAAAVCRSVPTPCRVGLASSCLVPGCGSRSCGCVTSWYRCHCWCQQQGSIAVSAAWLTTSGLTAQALGHPCSLMNHRMWLVACRGMLRLSGATPCKCQPDRSISVCSYWHARQRASLREVGK